MLRLKHLVKIFPWYKKLTYAGLIIIGQCGVMSLRTKTNTPRLRRFTTLYLLIRVMVEIETNQGKFWVSLKKISVSIANASRFNLPTLPKPTVTPSLSRKTKSKVTRI